jgi:hypothetical protein
MSCPRLGTLSNNRWSGGTQFYCSSWSVLWFLWRWFEAGLYGDGSEAVSAVPVVTNASNYRQIYGPYPGSPHVATNKPFIRPVTSTPRTRQFAHHPATKNEHFDTSSSGRSFYKPSSSYDTRAVAPRDAMTLRPAALSQGGSGQNRTLSTASFGTKQLMSNSSVLTTFGHGHGCTGRSPTTMDSLLN